MKRYIALVRRCCSTKYTYFKYYSETSYKEELFVNFQPLLCQRQLTRNIKFLFVMKQN